MAVRRLIVSDTHFGSGDDLLASPAALERIEPELAWADELVVNGDLLELVFASMEQAVDAARPFLALAARRVERIHYLPGNHDHHLVSMAADERRFGAITGAPAPAAGVAPATRLLRALCPGVDVVTAYPACELDGLHITHGHYIAAHVSSSDWRLMDNLAWQLTGTSTRPDQLTVGDYEGLIAPLYELMYEIASLPCGHRAQQRFEQLLNRLGAVARAPQHATRLLAGLAHAGRARALAPHDAPATDVQRAMQHVCANLGIRSGTVAFGHTHVPLDGVTTPDGGLRLFNAGSWIWDHRTRDAPDHHWPGTVLRATGTDVELRNVLADCDEHALSAMVGHPARPPRRAPRSHALRAR